MSPMVIRLVSVADQMPLHEFHDVFRTILGWKGYFGIASNNSSVRYSLVFLCVPRRQQFDLHFIGTGGGELAHFLGRSTVGWSSRNFSRMAAVWGHLKKGKFTYAKAFQESSD
jgi:hypothetical protein